MGTVDPGATTFSDLVTEVIADLQGYVRDQESATHLTAAIDADDLTLTVADVSKGAGVGVLEIGDEMLWAQQADRNSNTITVAPYGRGYQSTTAASHSIGDRVTFGPRFPRFRVKRAVNQTIAAMGDQLPALGNTEFDVDVAVAYELPAEAETVVDLRWQRVGPSERWEPVRNWSMNLRANTTEFTTGVSVDIWDQMTVGQPVRVTYFKNPTLLSADGDLFTATGWAASVFDVVKYGTLSRLIGAVDAARLDYKSIEADQLDTPTPFGSAQSLSKYYQQMFLMRLDEERQRLMERFQPRVRRAY